MTNAQPQTPPPAGYVPVRPAEDVVKGGMFALAALPVGVVLLVLLSSIGFVASIVGFVVSALALWLYRRGSGGFISRNGALVVTGVVAVTLLVGIWATLLVSAAGGLGQLSRIFDPNYQAAFSANFGALIAKNGLFILLILAFGALGAFRTLGRAFAIARQPRTTEQLFSQQPGQPGQPGQAPGPIYGGPTYGAPTNGAPTNYTSDVDGAPTGSADDKTPPPTSRD